MIAFDESFICSEVSPSSVVEIFITFRYIQVDQLKGYIVSDRVPMSFFSSRC